MKRPMNLLERFEATVEMLNLIDKDLIDKEHIIVVGSYDIFWYVPRWDLEKKHET